jgi:hypothetical protein
MSATCIVPQSHTVSDVQLTGDCLLQCIAHTFVIVLNLSVLFIFSEIVTMDTLMTSKATRAASNIWLVGVTEENFKASKLPSRGEVLKVLFHYHNREQMSLKDSTAKTTEMLLQVWEKARIPAKAPNHVVEHVRKLHSEWQGLKKLFNRASASNLKTQQMFEECLNIFLNCPP